MKFLLILVLIFPAVVWGKNYFTAAVFEHRPRSEPSPDKLKVVSSNLQFFEKAAEVAAGKVSDQFN